MSGGCMDCEERSLIARSACQSTPPSVGWSLRQSCLSTIIELTLLGTVKFRVFSTLSMFGVKICKVMTESLSITSAQGNMTAMRMIVMVMARTTRSYNIIMKTCRWINNYSNVFLRQLPLPYLLLWSE